MPLSTTGYFTTGTQPGSAGTNGNYYPVNGANATFNGATQYTNGTDFLSFYAGNASGGYWGVMTTPTGGGLTYSAPGTPTSFPLTGWGVYPGNTAPAPTFAVSLPSQLIASGVSGSGSSVASLNGTYTLSNPLDSQGLQYYVENAGGNYLYYTTGSPSWWFSPTLDGIGQGQQKAGSAGVAPLGAGWSSAGNPAQWTGTGLTVAVAVSLPSQVTVSGSTGSGSDASIVNGPYTLSSNFDSQGLQYYVENSGGNYLYYSNSQSSWWISLSLGAIGVGWYKAGSSGTLPLGASWTTAGNAAVYSGSGLTLGTGNPQVTIGGAYISCPGTGTTAASSGAWQVYNSVGTLVDSGASPGTNGANSLFNVGAPTAAGSAVNVKALAAAVAGTNYTFQSTYTPGSSSGPFDVVAAVVVAVPSSISGVANISGVFSIKF